MNDMEREMAKVTAGTIRLRLKMARDERWIRWAIGISSVFAGVAFAWRGEFGLACTMVFASFYYCFVTPRAEAAGRRAGWGMAWMNATAIVTQHPGVDRELVQQISLAAQMSWTEESELAQARLLLQQIEQMLKDDDHAAE